MQGILLLVNLMTGFCGLIFFSFSELKVALHWDMSIVLLSSLHWYVLGIIQLFYVQWTIFIMVDNQCNGRGLS